MSGHDLQVYRIIKFFEKCETRAEKEEIIVWIPFHKLKEYTELIGYDYFSEEGEDVNLRDSCIAFDIVPVMEYFEVYYEDLIKILEEE